LGTQATQTNKAKNTTQKTKKDEQHGPHQRPSIKIEVI